MASATHFDILVIGGGINGVGIARDAAGRGLKTLLVEKDDLAAATSSWSTKLIHGGLRYLEHYEFRLVGESLAERELLLHAAPHLIAPLSFVLPHEPHLRPAWMIRAGLFLYDRIGGKMTLPRSFGVSLRNTPWGAGLKPRFDKGFVYADAQVDDARLVVLTAVAAREKGADIRTRTAFAGAQRDGDGGWRVTLQPATGDAYEVRAKAIVNVGGPWVKKIRDSVVTAPARENVRHVKGSHIIVPRIHTGEHAYILQNSDKRIVFVIPYLGEFSLIGTTDVPVSEFEHPQISEEEIDYLLDLANIYVDKPLSRTDIVGTFSGIRPLYDDGASDPSAITRDYVLRLDGRFDQSPQKHEAPLLSVYGGKLTTYRKLAEAVMTKLHPYFVTMGAAWTHAEPLPGGDIPNHDITAWKKTLTLAYPQLPNVIINALAHRHGARAKAVLGDAKMPADLGRDFGGTLTEREVRYCVDNEWAMSADDLLWRRTKAGLKTTSEQQQALREFLRDVSGCISGDR